VEGRVIIVKMDHNDVIYCVEQLHHATLDASIYSYRTCPLDPPTTKGLQVRELGTSGPAKPNGFPQGDDKEMTRSKT
jgi:hypothetical protein